MESELIKKLRERIYKRNNRGEIMINGLRLKDILMSEINEDEADFLSKLINNLFIIEEDLDEFEAK